MTKKIKLEKRLLSLAIALAMLFCILPPASANAATGFDGKWAMTESNSVPVYGNSSLTSRIGAVNSTEGFSLLYWYDYNGTCAYIEYSTSSGAKRGYIRWDGGNMFYQDPSCVALVTRNCNLYYGTNTSAYQVSGSVSSGEIVAVLAKNDDWVYVEYNSPSGRKRGYMSYSNLDCYNRPSWFKDLYTYQNSGYDKPVSGTYNVRSGPSTQYPAVGTISNEVVKAFDTYTIGGVHVWTYIEYNTANGQKKSGFVCFTG